MTNRRRRTAGIRTGTTVLLLAYGLSACASIESELPQVDWSTLPELSGVRIETLESGMDRPWGHVWLPDGGLLITERDGRLWHVPELGDPRVDVDGVPEVFAEGQGGLLDIALHPDFAENRLIYLAFASGTRNANRTRVWRYRFTGSRLSNGTEVFAVNADKSGGQHFGSRLFFLPDGTLLISIGDGGNPPIRFEGDLQREQAQNPETLFGNVIRVNADGSIPPDNPFLDQTDTRPEFFTTGHRNVQGLALDSATGFLWVSEHGSRGGDELNRLIPGENYGWPLVSHSREYVRGTRVSENQTLPGYADPALVWMETIAPSGLAAADGVLYAGGLVSQAIHVVTTSDSGEYLDQSVIPIGARVRDVRFAPDGTLSVLTDEEGSGRLLRVTLP